VSVSSGGVEGNGDSIASSISADHRFVAFSSRATTLVVGDTNGCSDVFVHDNQTGTTERVSIDSAGTEGNNDSYYPSISADGRFVAFWGSASNLVAGDTNGVPDVFVHDRLIGTTWRVSVDSAGVQGNAYSNYPSISADGRFVAFWSFASNLVVGDTNGVPDVFVHEIQGGTTERVSVDSAGVQGNDDSLDPSISADGRFVAFASLASSLVAGDTNLVQDIFVHDRLNGTTERVSVDTAGAQANDDSQNPSISADGRFVAFDSDATNLVASDTNGVSDIFVHDRQSGMTERVSIDSGGTQSGGNSYWPSISANGHFVAYYSDATNLVAGDTNAAFDVFVHDRLIGTTERVSVATGGAEGNARSLNPSISADGRFVAFESVASNLVAGDTNGFSDIFVHDSGPTIPPGTDLCQAGTGGVYACPCSNPPANAPRGCDNSSATGGAQLTSTGTASLAFDSVVFVTNGERPTATSVVLQGNAGVITGVAFGQGVRCAGGMLRRLYTKTASGGSITAPGLGDPSVSARSAVLGDTITAGTSRWYAVYYRDPIVLGGCPAGSTFNISQTQRVSWAP
jgi:hypothetical protein